MIPFRMMATVFIVAALGYVGLSFALFRMPATAAAAIECGFLPEEFVSEGELTFQRTQAFLVSFQRKADYFPAATIGLAAAFAAFAVRVGRRGGAASAGLAAGGGLLAVSALCVGCIAPALSVVGIGVAGSFLVGVPKWLLFLNTLLLTGWGTLFLARRAQACPLSDRRMPPGTRSRVQA
ncbi:hypothetical protein [Aquabacter spiritensis]|uniref:Uncharacterized protein n=1 Tax=Aquabacter spiritensis TaxID=933073 RepID=A0A4R3LW88_9HYPH|nr:hypothetical protein [Aquabacter spiritensis]TCT04396.1 hypothetical protein EDC64_107214 [Aquabacter spiritensis]